MAKVLLTALKCGHPDCAGEGDWPMYRIKGTYYRCYGRGVERQGCGAPMIPVDALDTLVLGASEYWDLTPHVERVFVDGNALSARVDLLRFDMAKEIKDTPTGELVTVAQVYASRLAALEALGPVWPHVEAIETGETAGEHLRRLDLEGVRDYLASKDIKAWRDSDTRVCASIEGVFVPASLGYDG